MKKLLYISISFFLLSCNVEPTAEQIIDKSIAHYGGEAIYNSEISFRFRDIEYKMRYQKETFQLERSYKDSTGNFKDLLTNTSFVRSVNDTIVELTDEWSNKYSNSINSVIYFFRIPFHLNEKAVNKKMIGESHIKGASCFKIKVWFNEDGGGEDFSDVYIYWVNKLNYNIDYLAYSFETNGGGKRFREMVNARRINGLLVVDYINYKPKNNNILIENFDKYFQQNGMDKLSEIINENIRVKYLEEDKSNAY